MSTTSNILLPGRRYLLPNCSILTLDEKMSSKIHYHLQGFISQETSIQIARDVLTIKLINCGTLPATWIQMDSPIQTQIINQYCLAPEKDLLVPGCDQPEDAYFLSFNAFYPSPGSFYLYPKAVRIKLSNQDNAKILVQFYID